MNNKKFAKQLEDPKKNAAYDFSVRSDTLLIAFGGIRGKLAMPTFEFFNIASPYPVKKMFIRDLSQCWYQKGFDQDPSIRCIDDLADYLRAKIEEAGVKRVVMVGNSAGGYAALLFGKILGVETVHAFGPQTFLDRDNRSRYGDSRWQKEISSMDGYPYLQKEYLDLKTVFTSFEANHDTAFHVYYDVNNRLDRIHSQRMEDFDQIRFHEFQNGGHNVIKWLKKQGLLKGILNESFGFSPV